MARTDPGDSPTISPPVLLVPAFKSLGVSIWEEGKQAALHLPRAPDSHQLGGTQQEVERDVVRNVWGAGGCGRGGQDDLTTLPRSLSLRSGGRKSGSEGELRTGGRTAVWDRAGGGADRG